MSKRTVDNHDELDEIDFDVDNQDIDDLPIHSDINLTDPDKVKQENVVYYNHRKYAAGLLWLAGHDIDENQNIKDKATLAKADFYCSRVFVQQTGYGFLKSGHRWGMPSIAAIAADALIGEWHGVFRAEDRWLYIAVHSDTIAPEGDQLFMTEEAAYNHFLAEADKFKWPKSYVPSHWKIKDSDAEIHISQLLEGIDPAILKPVNADGVFGGKANKTFAYILGFILAAFFILFVFSRSFFDILLPTRIADPLRSFEINSLVALPPEEPEPLSDPIQNLLQNARMTSPMRNIKACIENFDTLMVSIPGWNINQMQCRGNIVDATWRRTIGSLDDLRNYVDQFPFRVNTTYGSSGNFLASTTINDFNDLNNPLQLSERQNAILLLNRRFTGLGTLRVGDVPPMSDAYFRLTQTDEVVRPLNVNDLPSLKVTFQTDISPITIKENFNIPGLKLNSIQWRISQNQWLYDMQIYLYPENYKIPENNEE